MNKIGVIYALVCPFTSNIRYIGQTVGDPRARLRKHISESINKNRTHKESWILSLNKKGTKPIIEVIDEVCFEDIDFWEKHYISLYKSWGFDILNLTDGGQLNKMFSKETRDKIAKSLKGRKQSDLTKERRSKSNRIAWSNEDLIESQRNKLLGKSFVERFGEEKAKEIIDKIQLSRCDFKLSTESISKISKTLIEKYSNGEIVNPNKIEVVQLDLNGNYIKIWNSIADAKKSLNIKSCISYVCNGKRNKAGGFKWMYYDGYIKNKQK